MSRRKIRRRKKVSKIRLMVIILVSIVLLTFLGLKITENGVFTVIDASGQELVEQGTFKHFWFAQLKMNSLNTDRAYIQREDGKVVALAQGVVNLNTKAVTENTLYTTDGSNEQGYTNGSYGADALYITTSMDGTQVLMQISGVKGWVSVDDIQLYLYDDSLFVSSYTASEGSLIHTISTDLLQGNVNPLSIGLAPDFMEEGTSYYSYDGHYFYLSYEQMSQDISHNTYENAVNTKPYFNYYQYVPHRSVTHLTSENYNAYLESMGFTEKASEYPCQPNQSALYDLGNTFLEVQDQTGINASMMFAVALNESGYGQSQYALTNYNLFGHAAYDANPDSATTYTSYEDCIYQHAYGFIQNGYANLNDSRYHGSWFGDKASGVNVQYASDPYWGEKAAHFYYLLDTQNNNIDSKDIKIQTVLVNRNIPVYADTKRSVTLYTYEPGDVASFVIENKEEKDGQTWYTVSSEMPIQDQKLNPGIPYDNSVGYVNAEDLK